MLTIKDIAQLCNVSPATVSNVINGKANKVSKNTADFILSKIEEIGYKPNFIAKGLRTSKTKILGVIAEDISLFNVPPIINGITACCEEYGYMFLLENLRLYDKWGGSWFEDPVIYNSVFAPAMSEMEAINADGIIYVAGHSRKINAFSQDPDRPVVVAYSITEDMDIPQYVVDDVKAAYDMTNYLIEKGHTRIGVIGGERSNLHTLLRMEGYQKALFEHGILYDPTIIQYGEWARETGRKMAEPLIDRGVSAIFCFADYIAGGVYDYLNSRKMVAGKDIAVCGFDNHEYASYMSPGLTTLQLPTQDIGFRSTKRLIEMIEGRESEDDMENKLACQLIERESV